MRIRHSTKPVRPEYPNLIIERRERLKRILSVNAPEVIVVMMAEHYLDSFRISWRQMWSDFKMHKLPHWLYWLIDSDYRAVCRMPDEDLDDFEKKMREMLAPTEEDNG